MKKKPKKKPARPAAVHASPRLKKILLKIEETFPASVGAVGALDGWVRMKDWQHCSNHIRAALTLTGLI